MRFLRLLNDHTPAQQLARGSLISFLLQAIGAGLIFSSELVLARALNTQGYGLYATTFAWLQVLTLVALLGSNNLLLRFIPAYVATKQWSLLHGLLRQCGRGAILIGVCIFIATVLILYFLSDRISSDIRWAFIIGIAALPVYALSLQRQAILRGLHYVASALSPEYIIRPLALLAFVSCFVWGLNIPLSAAEILALNGVAILLSFVVGWYWQRRSMPAEIASAPVSTRSSEWLDISIPLFLIAMLQLLIVRMDIILLGAIAGHEQAGIYAAASKVSELIVFALAAANVVVAPIVAGLYAGGDMHGLQNVMVRLAAGVLAFTVPLVLLVVSTGHAVLGVFGAEFQVAYVPLLILVCGQIVNALSGPVDFIMYMTGHQKQALQIFALVTVLNLALNLLLIPAYGLEGAAIATASSVIIWNLLMRYYVRSRLGIEASVMVLFRQKAA